MPCVVGGGFLSRPKPSSTCSGESTSAVPATSASRVSPARPSRPVPPSAPRLVMRRSISTNRPDSGRFDQSELAVTWKKHHLAVAALGRGDERRAVLEPRPDLHVRPERLPGPPAPAGSPAPRAARSGPRTGRRRRTGPAACGVDHDKAPPSVRPPSRRATGSRSSPPFSSRGPAKRTSTPPSLHPVGELIVHVLRQRADVGQHDHGHLALEDGVDGRRAGCARSLLAISVKGASARST